MRTVRAAILGALLVMAPFASSCAEALSAPAPTPGLATARPAQAAPVQNASPGPQAARARLLRLEARVRGLKRRMWRLRVRRRQFLAQGMPAHAHRIHERIIALGWRLRRAQGAARALMGHAGPMSPRR